MNPLNDFPRARRVAYYIQFVVAGLVLLIGVGYAAADAALPTWYVVTAAVTSGLWSYLGLTAAQNTHILGKAFVGQHRDEAGRADVLYILAVILVAVLILALLAPML